MSSHAPVSPEVKTDLEETAIEPSPILPTLGQQQANVGLGSDSNGDEEDDTDEPDFGERLENLMNTLTIEELAEMLSEDDAEVDIAELKVYLLSARADAAESDFKRLGVVKDIDEAIKHRSQVLSLTPDGHPEKPQRLGTLGTALLRRFVRTGEPTDIDEAIECLSQAVFLTPDGDESKIIGLTNLGNSYEHRFGRLGELEDLNKAIDYQTQAVLLTPDGHADKFRGLGNLGGAYHARFGRLGEVVDLENAIEYQSQAVLLAPDGHADKPCLLNNLGVSYCSRFERIGGLADLDKAIESQTQAVLLTPDEGVDKAGWLNNLGNSYESRFGHLGKLVDLNKAIEYQTQAVLLTPEQHAYKPSRLGNLGISYGSRFERLGELADLDKSIEYLTQAVVLTPEGHAGKLSLLNNLGMAYHSRFEALGELADVDKAIEYKTEAVLLTPDGHADKLRRLNNLGTSYQSRFRRLGELADVDKAIEYKTQVMLLCPDQHADKPSWLNNLGVSYGSRFDRSGELADLDKAIEYQTQGVLLTPDENADKPGWLSNLGNSYEARFRRHGEPTDLEKAIEYNAEAVFLAPDGHAHKPRWLGNLGISYLSRFDHLGELADIDQSIKYMTQALLLTPHGHAGKPDRLNNLGTSYLSRFKRFGEVPDLQSAMSFFQNAAQHIVIRPELQSRCARMWAQCSSLLGHSPRLAYERCMELIPYLIWLGTTIDQRYSLLNELSDLAAEAAAWAISVQEYELALEWLEEGRSIVWNQILQLRTPFDDLSSVNPMLAQQLKDTATKLEGAGSRQATPTSSFESASDLEKSAQQHHSLAIEWERLLGMAREIPGFHNFLRPRKAAELTHVARDCPVVAINVHHTRCDALIIHPHSNEITHVPLEGFSLESAISEREQLVSLIAHQGVRGMILRPAESPLNFRKVLATLWLDMAKPILGSLGYMRKLPVSQLPRLIWCTTGPLTFLPLHAAGCYDGTEPSAPDVVISSYTPTLSALLSPELDDTSSYAGLLAIGQEKYSNGLSNLPGTVDELAAIRKHADVTRYTQLEGRGATVDAVLKAMNEHSWVHLACHAIQNREETSHSAFHLHDGSLTLKTITKQSFKNKGLAFLSACQTATGDDKLPDESLHLAAGMLTAGYPAVIATMWSIWDTDAPDIAREVYAELLKDTKMDWKEAARALHKAVAILRDNVGQDSFKRWVPFIHIGM